MIGFFKWPEINSFLKSKLDPVKLDNPAFLQMVRLWLSLCQQGSYKMWKHANLILEELHIRLEVTRVEQEFQMLLESLNSLAHGNQFQNLVILLDSLLVMMTQ